MVPTQAIIKASQSLLQVVLVKCKIFFIFDNKNNKNKNSLHYTSMWECMDNHIAFIPSRSIF